MEKLVVKKKEGIACWKVVSEGVCPNTVIELDEGVTLIVYVEGQRKMSAKRAFTIHSLLNPGKEKKLCLHVKNRKEEPNEMALERSTQMNS